jgi:RNA polymerase sigma-70 factor (ECF subfamily)
VRKAVDLSGDGGLRAAYANHGPELYRFALRGLGDSGLAQDAVQETFLRAWQSARHFDPDRASLRVWLFAIARNVMIDLHRRRSKASWANVGGDETAVTSRLAPVPDATDGVLARAVVADALGRLSAEHRQVIVETHLRGRSYEDLAAECGVAAGTLRSRMFYALKALRVAMDNMGVSL